MLTNTFLRFNWFRDAKTANSLTCCTSDRFVVQLLVVFCFTYYSCTSLFIINYISLARQLFAFISPGHWLLMLFRSAVLSWVHRGIIFLPRSTVSRFTTCLRCWRIDKFWYKNAPLSWVNDLISLFLNGCKISCGQQKKLPSHCFFGFFVVFDAKYFSAIRGRRYSNKFSTFKRSAESGNPFSLLHFKLPAVPNRTKPCSTSDWNYCCIWR